MSKTSFNDGFKIDYDDFTKLVNEKQYEYGINGEIDHLKFFDICTEVVWYHTSGNENIKNTVELLILLKNAFNDKTGIRVQSLKTSDKCDYKDFNTMHQIIRWLETKIFLERGVYYDENFLWDICKKYALIPDQYHIGLVRTTWMHNGGIEYVLKSDIEPYSMEQLSEILKNENDLIVCEKLAEQNRKAQKITNAILHLKESGIFKKELKTIPTNEASFLYDVMEASCQEFPVSAIPLINQEKYQYIKRYLKYANKDKA